MQLKGQCYTVWGQAKQSQPGLHPAFSLLLLVVKKLADFELPYTSLQSSEMENCKIGLRKW